MQTITDHLNTETKTRAAHCDTHGSFTSRQFLGAIWTRCPICAREADEAQRAAKEKAERERRIHVWQQRLGHAGIPERFRDRTLDSYIAETDGQRAALAFARRYAANFGHALETGESVIFNGLPGTGKTHLSIGIALQVMARGHSALFTTTLRAIRRVKDTWARGAEESESEAIDALVFPDLLILDEVGVQFGSETERLILFDVINARYEGRRPTFLLSNLAAPELKGYLGERVFDRLREDGGRMIVFDWPSARGRIGSSPSTTPPVPAGFNGRPQTGNPLLDGCV